MSDVPPIQDDETRRKVLRLVAEQIPGVVWTTDRELRFTSSDGAGLVGLGLKPGQVVGMTMSDYFGGGEEGVVPITAHLRALEGHSSIIELTHVGRTFQSHIGPLTDDNRIVGTIGLAIDVTWRKEAERQLQASHGELEARVQTRTAELRDAVEAHRQIARRFEEIAESKRLLLLELDHRVRNNLASLMALVGLMRDSSTDVKSFADAMESRLVAMAHVHHLLNENDWKPVDLRVLISTLMEASSKLAPETVLLALEGPSVEIDSARTLPLAMILVEWLTNSVKYGAHSSPTGRLRISWAKIRSDGTTLLNLEWLETGGPPPAPDPAPSIGAQLVQRFATRWLKGEVEMDYAPSGARLHLRFPLSNQP